MLVLNETFQIEDFAYLNPIWIGNDHGGVELKSKIVEYFERHRVPYHDVGSNKKNIVRYPNYAALVASSVAEGRISRGILICSTGIGMSIIANKYKGVRASLCTSIEAARKTRAHNNSNILCLAGITEDYDLSIEIVKTWITTKFEGGRHAISTSLINIAEEVMATGRMWVPDFINDSENE